MIFPDHKAGASGDGEQFFPHLLPRFGDRAVNAVMQAELIRLKAQGAAMRDEIMRLQHELAAQEPSA
jgi:hypothetical protein